MAKKKRDKTSTSTTNINLSEDAERNICYFMNLDHAVILHAIAKSTLSRKIMNNKHIKISNAKLININLENAIIEFVACDDRNGSCTKRNVTVKFDPPVTSQLELRPRLISMQDQMMRPKLSWFLSDSTCRLILISMGLLGYAHHFCDLQRLLQQSPEVGNFFITLFGSTDIMRQVVKVCWYFGVIAHVLEAFYGAYLSRYTLNLSPMISFQWFLAISLVGYPMTTRVIEFSTIKSDSMVRKSKLQ